MQVAALANGFEAVAAPRGDVSSSVQAEHNDLPSTPIASGSTSSFRVSRSSSLMAEECDAGDNQEDMRSKDANGEARDASGETSRAASLRSTSSKIASLRATFEKHSPVDGAAKRRFPSAPTSERKTDSHISEREREYWKEIARLRDERDKEHELRQAYEEKCAALEAELGRLQQGLNGNSSAESGKAAVAEAELERFHVVKTRTDDVSVLQQQLSDLKRNISTSTRMDSQVTDSTFAQEMGVLHHELQNWIVNNFRRVKAEVAPAALSARLEGIEEPTHTSLLNQIYAVFDPAVKLAVYQATAVVFLMDIFTERLLFGLPSEQEWCKHILQAAENLEHQLKSIAYNKWRAATLEAIQQSEGFEVLVQSAVTHVTETISSVLGKLTDSEPNAAALSGIVKRAVSLAHLLRLQRARYDLYLPSPTDAFDPATMEDVSDCSEGQPGSAVRCAIFPALLKIGDEYGDSVHLRNTIVKAKVLCKGSEP
ncbi:hypothetical protein LTR36_010776 [Oleoguttula mirabilis]|uniref:Uncharacterized protein n=1 Tax=Oleoguttula mirabilis TaxID=1507867 RepID=A0AAV9JS47_9PEZI|nr:hypothetical protein LTR36_010776 [Oleoguttula mirabilis]